MSHSIQIDAEFLEDPELNAAASSNQVAGLQASHLLNLQCTELLQACLLSTESSSSWFPAATEYTRVLADLLHAMPPLARGMIESSDVNATTKTIQGQNPFLPPLRVLMPSQYSSGQSVLLTTAANAHVLPTQALTVLLPTAFFSKNDYRKGRYFEVCRRTRE